MSFDAISVACSAAAQCCGYCGANCGISSCYSFHVQKTVWLAPLTAPFGVIRLLYHAKPATICLQKKPVCFVRKSHIACLNSWGAAYIFVGQLPLEPIGFKLNLTCLAPLTMSFSVIRWGSLGIFHP